MGSMWPKQSCALWKVSKSVVTFQAETRIVRITSLSLINEEQSRESGRYIVVFVGQVNYYQLYFAVNLSEK